jgi:hypothetical protein
MKATVHSTSKKVHLNGLETRIWEGHTEKGIPFVMFVALVRVESHVDSAEFDQQLTEHAAPSSAASAISPRMIL